MSLFEEESQQLDGVNSNESTTTQIGTQALKPVLKLKRREKKESKDLPIKEVKTLSACEQVAQKFFESQKT